MAQQAASGAHMAHSGAPPRVHAPSRPAHTQKQRRCVRAFASGAQRLSELRRVLQAPEKSAQPLPGPEPAQVPVTHHAAPVEFLDEGEHEEWLGTVKPSKQLPREARYFDRAKIHAKAGEGGKGCCAFRREKFVAHGGPSGGNGGSGGSVWVVAEEGMNSLMTFRNNVHWRAQGGTAGQGKDMHGAAAPDLFIKVPVGTIVRRAASESNGSAGEAADDRPLAEVVAHGDQALVLEGGRGGRGNAAFKSASNKAPVIAEDGQVGDESWLELELKVVADVGIIGVPNAGKSTLLRNLSNATPKVANYPFTTLVPHLGVCEMDFEATVFADIPGLIEGAHQGDGLGHEFLRHVSRARMLVHVIDGTSPDPLYDFKAIQLELELYGHGLSDKPQVVAYNKVDIPDSRDYVQDVRELLLEGDASGRLGHEDVVPISAATGEGVLDLLRRVRTVLKGLPEEPTGVQTNAINQQMKTKPSARQEQLSDFWIDCLDEGSEHPIWIVHGKALEQFAQMTNWDYFEASLRFERVLHKCGLWGALEAQGVQEGDTVVIGQLEFLWRSASNSQGQMYQIWMDSMKEAGKGGRGSARWPQMAG